MEKGMMGTESRSFIIWNSGKQERDREILNGVISQTGTQFGCSFASKLLILLLSS
jgi:hypothetical protein